MYKALTAEIAVTFWGSQVPCQSYVTQISKKCLLQLPRACDHRISSVCGCRCDDIHSRQSALWRQLGRLGHVLPRSSSIAGPETPHHFHLPDLETERPRLLRECFPCLELGHPKPLAPGLCQAFQKNDPSQLLSPS